MAIIFDGKKLAREIEADLTKQVAVLKKRGITPHLETILDGANPASVLYTKLKTEAAERIGAEAGVYPIARQKRDRRTMIKSFIRTLNEDPSVHGIMVQLPLTETVELYTREILQMIMPKKDVDGHLAASRYKPAVVSAILKIIGKAKESVDLPKKNSLIKVVVVGSRGNVGKALVRELKSQKYDVRGVDKKVGSLRLSLSHADIVVSAAGSPGIIKGHLVKEGVVLIDAGAPKGDVLFNEVVGKASFITPVPGGVGPVTVASLMENLVAAAGRSKRV